MPNEVNIYTPRYLAEVVRLAPPVYTFSAIPSSQMSMSSRQRPLTSIWSKATAAWLHSSIRAMAQRC